MKFLFGVIATLGCVGILQAAMPLVAPPTTAIFGSPALLQPGSLYQTVLAGMSKLPSRLGELGPRPRYQTLSILDLPAERGRSARVTSGDRP